MSLNNYKILILGANGLFGNIIFNYLNKNNFSTWAGLSSKKDIKYFNKRKKIFYKKIFSKKSFKIFSKNIDKNLKKNKFNFVINCIGHTIHQKNISYSKKLLINSYLPRLLSFFALKYNFKFIHLSSDCVFDGKKGNYKETDNPNSNTEYGKSKKFGEILNNLNTITLRTSGIGHSLYKNNCLLDWFLYQKNKKVYGYRNFYFSGPTTLEVAKVIKYIIETKKFKHGLFHISSQRISKLNLLSKLNKIYNNNTIIIPKTVIKIDRSLNSSKFRKIYKYEFKNWNYLINDLKEFNENKIIQ